MRVDGLLDFPDVCVREFPYGCQRHLRIGVYVYVAQFNKHSCLLVEVDGWGFNPCSAGVVFVVGWDGYCSAVCLSCATRVLSV